MTDKQLREAQEFASVGRWDKIMAIVEANPELAFAQDVRGDTLLMICSRYPGSESVVQRLIQLGADVNWRKGDYSNVLAAAICSGSRYGLNTLPIIEMLIKAGADVNATADCGMPALHWAVAQNKPEYMQALLNHGADPNLKSVDGEDAFDIAKRMRSKETMDILRQDN